MKTILKFFFLAACIQLLSACSKPDLITDDLPGNDLKKASKHCPEIVVVPENGHDTENLLAAFEEAKSLGPGTTIRLTEGTYTIGMIEVHDFDGVLTGAGQGKTIITNLPDLPCDEIWVLNQLPALLTFVGGNVSVSYMTFHIQDGQPCLWGPINDGMYGDFSCILALTDYSKYYVPETRNIKGLVDNVDFIAGNDDGYGYYQTPGNVAMHIYCGAAMWFPEEFMPLSKGEFSFTNCTFKDALASIDVWGFDENSSFNILRNVIEGGLQQIFLGSVTGSVVNIKHNQIGKGIYADLYVEGGDQGYYLDLLPLKATKYSIDGNSFKSPAGIISLYVNDNFRLKNSEGVATQLYDIKGNVFNTSEGGMAIWSQNTKNAKIWNNQFLGTGSAGVMMNGDEPTGTYSEGNQLTGNNFLGATYSDATIYLGPVTRNNKVVGVSQDKVVDEGINNLIIGTKANKHGVPPLRPLFKKIKPLR
jgi:hypothetical protein